MTTTAKKKTTKKSPFSSVMKNVAAKDAAKAKRRKNVPDEIVEPVAKAKKPATKPRAGKPAKKGTTMPKKPARATPANDAAKTAKPDAKTKKLSGLDYAAQVLAKSKEPLAAKAITEQAIAAGWKTNGATPHATLYAAMIREIAKKGDESRFRKTDRGLFTVSKGGK